MTAAAVRPASTRASPQGAVAHVTIENAAKLNTLGSALMIEFVERGRGARRAATTCAPWC